ncbi:MBL fold metallo-hydrolase [Desulfitobacterium sp.]|uniref:MBL fold metallo-hydrolase n=1 Tax=Desulfitobacterium sp. TaxID=49981 RepID=UPI002C12DDBE|nr:MBL fold metallo-hydrolase [Desulfitobacterium sp.]HVJ49677.1 MBL fold metallo-hydrolase [Desulfitobacterium sp.]
MLKNHLVTGINTMTYVSNAGVLIQLQDKKILIDGLCDPNQPFYKNPPAEISAKIKGGMPPFDNIDLMLITHQHSDHFDPISIHEFRKRNPNTIILSTSEVISKIKTYASDNDAPDTGIMNLEHNLIELKTALHHAEMLTVKGINIRILSMLHSGKSYDDVRNFSYLIEYGLRILHVGDASPVRENYDGQNLRRTKIDWFIAPFPYIALPSARVVIKEYINPQKIAIVHLPNEERDRFGWIKATHKSFGKIEHDFIETIFLEELGSTIGL